MKEQIFNGIALAAITTEAKAINDYNSIRFWVKGVEFQAEDVKMVVYQDKEELDYKTPIKSALEQQFILNELTDLSLEEIINKAIEVFVHDEGHANEALAKEYITKISNDIVLRNDGWEPGYVVSECEICTCCQTVLLPDDECYGKHDGETLCSGCSILCEGCDKYYTEAEVDRDDEDYFACKSCIKKDKDSRADKLNVEIEKVSVIGYWKDSNGTFEADVAIGTYDGISNDDDVMYWFEAKKEILGDHGDFVITSIVDSASSIEAVQYVLCLNDIDNEIASEQRVIEYALDRLDANPEDEKNFGFNRNDIGLEQAIRIIKSYGETVIENNDKDMVFFAIADNDSDKTELSYHAVGKMTDEKFSGVIYAHSGGGNYDDWCFYNNTMLPCVHPDEEMMDNDEACAMLDSAMKEDNFSSKCMIFAEKFVSMNENTCAYHLKDEYIDKIKKNVFSIGEGYQPIDYGNKTFDNNLCVQFASIAEFKEVINESRETYDYFHPEVGQCKIVIYPTKDLFHGAEGQESNIFLYEGEATVTLASKEDGTTCDISVNEILRHTVWNKTTVDGKEYSYELYCGAMDEPKGAFSHIVVDDGEDQFDVSIDNDMHESDNKKILSIVVDAIRLRYAIKEDEVNVLANMEIPEEGILCHVWNEGEIDKMEMQYVTGYNDGGDLDEDKYQTKETYYDYTSVILEDETKAEIISVCGHWKENQKPFALNIAVGTYDENIHKVFDILAWFDTKQEVLGDYEEYSLSSFALSNTSAKKEIKSSEETLGAKEEFILSVENDVDYGNDRIEVPFGSNKSAFINDDKTVEYNSHNEEQMLFKNLSDFTAWYFDDDMDITFKYQIALGTLEEGEEVYYNDELKLLKQDPLEDGGRMWSEFIETTDTYRSLIKFPTVDVKEITLEDIDIAHLQIIINQLDDGSDLKGSAKKILTYIQGK